MGKVAKTTMAPLQKAVADVTRPTTTALRGFATVAALATLEFTEAMRFLTSLRVAMG